MGGTPPRVFCRRARKTLIAKGLGKHSFFESVEECENRGVNSLRFVANSEKSEGAEAGRRGKAGAIESWRMIAHGYYMFIVLSAVRPHALQEHISLWRRDRHPRQCQNWICVWGTSGRSGNHNYRSEMAGRLV
jgi:hypothetical protein